LTPKKCIEGFYLNKLSNSCEACSNGAVTCDSPTSATKCKSGFAPLNKECLSCTLVSGANAGVLTCGSSTISNGV
jgi:hypothetical protein